MEVAKNCMYLYIPYRCKVEQLDALHIMGRQILKRNCACGSKEFCEEEY